MASAQVLPNPAASSRKQGHLEAGKKRLEEFRKKKAEGQAKKVASTGQLQVVDMDQQGEHSKNNEQANDGSMQARNNTNATDSYVSVRGIEVKAPNSSQNAGIGSSNDIHATSRVLTDNDHSYYGNGVQDNRKDESSNLNERSVFPESTKLFNDYNDWGVNTEFNHNKHFNYGSNNNVSADGFDASDPGHEKKMFERNISHSRFHVESPSGENINSSNININDHNAFGSYIMSARERAGDVTVQNRLGFPSTSSSTSGVSGGTLAGVEQYIPGITDPGLALGGRKVFDFSHQNSADSAPWHASEPPTTGLSLPVKLFNENPFPSNDSLTLSGRSRPSFLHSLGLPRVSSTSHEPYYEDQETNLPVSFIDPKPQITENHSSSSSKQLFLEPSALEQSHKLRIPDSGSEQSTLNSSITSNSGQLSKLVASNHLHEDQELRTKKDEDFAALEQYIEDLTQEKFSLQRALDTSRNLAESLVAETSALTESYNQQGQVVNQLKSDMERLQEEMKAQQLALDSFKLEYTNAQLECNAADERAKVLASEVITLEEKVLRLRSNELKLEKQLENMNSEITSYKRKVSSLEKERQDFQSTIDALQEEKKLLQSKLRKASTEGKLGDSLKIPSIKRDASTSTQDLGMEDLNLIDKETNIAERIQQNALEDMGPSAAHSASTGFVLLPEDRSYLLEDSRFIPNDQLRMIDNINSLVSELALQKEELMQALSTELSNSSKLKDLNMDLSRKLEAQTQRLELLTAQRMVNENSLQKPIDTRILHDPTEYADEGDEVVERVLGWIMKLFPGGSAKRRTSKLV